MCIQCIERLFDEARALGQDNCPYELGEFFARVGLAEPQTKMAKQLKQDLQATFDKAVR